MGRGVLAGRSAVGWRRGEQGRRRKKKKNAQGSEGVMERDCATGRHCGRSGGRRREQVGERRSEVAVEVEGRDPTGDGGLRDGGEEEGCAVEMEKGVAVGLWRWGRAVAMATVGHARGVRRNVLRREEEQPRGGGA